MSQRIPLLAAALLLPLIGGIRADAAVDPAVRDAQTERVALIERIAPSVVAIFAAGGQGGGSGVLVTADGYAVTNFHVVQGAGSFMKCGLNDGQVYDAVLVGIDPTGDVALIRLLGREDFPHATIGNSDSVRVGDWAYALGNPFLLATDFQPTVTFGMVSGVHRYQYPAGTFLEYTDCIQVDTSINPGNSGGPLFNEAGELIGINGRISVEKRGRVNVGAGYAISINQVMNFMDHLRSGRIVDHATLGATVVSRSDGTVGVASILEQSEAFRRGLRSGDELISFAGRPIRSVNQFKNILGIYPKGWKLPLSYRRDGERHDIYVRLRGLHSKAEISGGPQRPQPQPQPQPGPEDEDGEPRPQPRLPDPFHRQPKAEPPAEYAHMFEERAGYANYYFNRIERERLVSTLEPWGDFTGQNGLWEIVGSVRGGESFHFKLGDELLAVQTGNDVALQRLDEDFADVPEGTGGLLAAMHQLKQLLVAPEDYFTEYYYVGSEPLDGFGERVDVLITTRGLVTSRWYFSKADGHLIGFDTAVAEDADPCEIRFQGEASFGAYRLPQSFTVRHADEIVGEFVIEDVRL
ncbi:Periplasmic serine endoprotease DegP precursor [Maioricimonas rarisocia]|uniref:Periplasmic serine endoprotease DegP n=1 Tax=Maioricimonas rarisocia TaxID=2528026 RepID=A0A517Z148_9PLAN|nr:trypsin-like peptidase domain-containing protein [Maioricimonas rarisocia]QDU36198.1 Periplasmic serine endoprotease DegP precursor [Maioricimonas rarisocia]